MPIPAAHDRTCTHCETPLTAPQVVLGGICDDPACRLREAQERRKEKQAERRTLESTVRRMAAAAAPELGTARPHDLPVIVVPSNDDPVVPVPERRRRRFRDHLARIVSEAAELRAGGGGRARPADADREEPDAPDDPETATWLGHACATCRGWCCALGNRRHAFLTTGRILRTMEAHPELRPRHVLQRYLEHIGPRAYRDSCVYHGEHGCRLPRDLRSDTCNDFLCADLRDLLQSRRCDPPPPAMLFGAAEDGEVRRVAVADERGRREV